MNDQSAAAVKLGCYECGSEEGSSFRMCQACIDHKREEKAKVRKEFRAGPGLTGAEDEEPQVSIDSPEMKAIGLLFVWTLVFGGYYFFGAVNEKGVLAQLLLAAAAGSYAASTLTWMYLWMRMIILEPLWALASLILPCLVYKYIALNPEDARPVAIVHFAFIALSLLFIYLLSLQLEVSFSTASFVVFGGETVDPVVTESIAYQ